MVFNITSNDSYRNVIQAVHIDCIMFVNYYLSPI